MEKYYRNPHPDKIVGLKSFDAKNITAQLEQAAVAESTHHLARERTPEETALIKNIYFGVSLFLKKHYSIKPRLMNIEAKVLLFNPSVRFESDIDDEMHTIGQVDALAHEIRIATSENDTQRLTHVLAHELVHVNSFLSVHEKSSKIQNRRIGLEISTSNSTESFRFLNEVVTELVTKEILDDPEFQAITGFDAHNDIVRPYENVHPEFRRLLIILSEHYSIPEDIILMQFTLGMFNGQIKDLARMIEEVFGRGSFRKIGERFSKIPVVINDILDNVRKRRNEHSTTTG